jgi:hypothetical protein
MKIEPLSISLRELFPDLETEREKYRALIAAREDRGVTVASGMRRAAERSNFR